MNGKLIRENSAGINKRVRRNLFILLIASAVLHLLIAGFTELGNDEVYYTTYAQHLQGNYFDHPPMIGLLIKLSTLNLQLRQEIFVRLCSIIFSAISTWFIYLTGKKIRDEESGFYAAILFNCSIYFGIIAGTFALPDAPLQLFWCIGIYFVTELIQNEVASTNRRRTWILWGLITGLAAISKLNGVFLWAGFGCYILFFDRKIFREAGLYFSFFLFLLFLVPIIWWNLDNHFVSFTFHQNRVGFFDAKPSLDSFLQHLIGTIAYQNPINIFLYAGTVLAITKKRIVVATTISRLYLLLSLPYLFIFLLVSIFHEALPHWTGPAFTTLCLLTGVWISDRQRSAQKFPAVLKWSSGLILFVVFAALFFIKFRPITIGSKEIDHLGKGDITLDLDGWKNFHRQFDSLYKKDLAEHKISSKPVILSDYWFPAAHLAYYVAVSDSLELKAIGGINAIHHFAWLNTYGKEIVKGSDAYFIYPSNYFGPPDASLLKCYAHADSTIILTQLSNQGPVRNFVITRLHNYRGGIPENGILEK